jgi:hypothetical protein
MAKTKTVTKTAPKPKTRTKKPGGDKVAAIKKLVDQISETWFDVAILMDECWEADTHVDKGYDSFADMALKEWGMAYKTAMNRRTAGMTIRKHGLKKTDLRKNIGMTNFIEISSLFEDDMSKREVTSLINKAGKMSHSEVQRFKKTTRQKKVGGETQKRVEMVFGFLDEQADQVVEIIEFAKEQFGLEDDDLALEYALVDWRQNTKDNARPKATIMKKLKGKPSAEEKDAPKAPKKKRADAGKKHNTKKGKKAAPAESEGGDDEFDFEDED